MEYLLSEPSQAEVKRWLRGVVAATHGCVNSTNLAELAADHFNHDEWLDDETHWLWELIYELCHEDLD